MEKDRAVHPHSALRYRLLNEFRADRLDLSDYGINLGGDIDSVILAIECPMPVWTGVVFGGERSFSEVVQILRTGVFGETSPIPNRE